MSGANFHCGGSTAPVSVRRKSHQIVPGYTQNIDTRIGRRGRWSNQPCICRVSRCAMSNCYRRGSAGSHWQNCMCLLGGCLPPHPPHHAEGGAEEPDRSGYWYRGDVGKKGLAFSVWI